MRVCGCSYNAVGGVPACASEALLGDTLRRRWKFSGFVVSDCGAVEAAAWPHRYRRCVRLRPPCLSKAAECGVP